MKIGVSSSGNWLESEIDFHTGRARCFIIYDTEQEGHTVFDNWKCTECVHWAGIKSSQILLDAGVDVMIVNAIGPNTFRLFTEAGIKVYHAKNMTVVRAIRLFREGALDPLREPNCEGHHHLK